MSQPTLSCPETPSDTGAYRISWNGPDGANYRLEENGNILYEGPELASTVTGRKEGTYSYRVGVVEKSNPEVGLWSSPCKVTVSPPPLWLAFTLLGLGLTVFIAILAIIIRGHRAHRRGKLG
jgi:hypothetical protein